MGAPMAGHLLRAGHEVTVWNRTASKAEPLVSVGARPAADPAAVAAASDIVMICVSRQEDMLEMVDRLSPGLRGDAIVVDHSTTTPAAALGAARRVPAFIDAPMTGGSMGAQAGTLTLFCGGSLEHFAVVEPVLAAYAKRVVHVGSQAAGQRMKLANQIAVGGALIGLCEALAFAEKAGLDLELTRELLNTGAAGSWAFTHYGPKIVNRDWSPGFSIDNQTKDFVYCQQEASELGMALPGTEVVQGLLTEMQAAGRGAETTAALFEWLLKESAS